MNTATTIIALASSACAISCKAFDRSKPNTEVRERSTETFPEIDVGSKEADTSAARLRPAASLGGTVAMFAAGARFCLAIHVKERFFLTAASCVFEPVTGYPRPMFQPGVRLTLGWTEPETATERKATARTLAVYAHPSYENHFTRPLAPDVYENREKLAGVADLAIVAVAFDDASSPPPLAKLSQETWPVDQELIALQGSCLLPTDPEKEPPALAGGRLLPQQKGTAAGAVRTYLDDSFSSSRALFDCDGFRGAPVFSENGKEVLAVTSWIHAGGLQRGITKVNDAPTQPESVSGWIARTLAEPPEYAAPQMNRLLSCNRQVTTGIGNFELSFEKWPVRLDEAQSGFLSLGELIFDLDLKITAPTDEASAANSSPLLPIGSTDVLQKRYKMVRDLRQPATVQFLSADKLVVGKFEILVSFITTDRETSLAIVTIFDPAEKKERTVNIYFGRFDSNEFCKLDSFAHATPTPTQAP